jgi:hypothetical protein
MWLPGAMKHVFGMLGCEGFCIDIKSKPFATRDLLRLVERRERENSGQTGADSGNVDVLTPNSQLAAQN